MNVIIRLKGIFYVNVKGAGKWQNSVEIINEALSFTGHVKQDDMVVLGTIITEVNPVGAGQSVPALQDQGTSISRKAAIGLISPSL